MSFIEAFKKVYIEEIFTINGRASRKEYWGSELIFLPSFFILLVIGYSFSEGIGDIISIGGYVWSLVANFTLAIRRAHDVGNSGWFMLIPIYNFVLTVSRSEQSLNKWGYPRSHTVNKGNEDNSSI